MISSMKPAEADCPTQKTAALLSDTWTMLIIRDLLAGPKRFCELERSLEGISTRTLTNKLKKLTSNDLIAKKRDREGIQTYAATPRGRGLRIVEQAMRRYGERYL